jgi:hypothetical protein
MSREPTDPFEIQRLGLDIPRVTLEDLARALGATGDDLQKYRDGRSQMPAIAKHRLAEFLREHADTLRRLAVELDRSG